MRGRGGVRGAAGGVRGAGCGARGGRGAGDAVQTRFILFVK